MEMAIFGERIMAPRTIHRNPQKRRFELLEFREYFVVEGHLIAADGAPVRRIESQNEWLAEQLAEGEFLIGCDMEGKFRGRSTGT
jgi:hypothetical protein